MTPAEVRGTDHPTEPRWALARAASTSSSIWVARAGAGRVLVATFVTLGLAYGFGYSYGVFLVAFLRQLYVAFGVLAALGVSAAGWVPSVVLIRGWFPSSVGTAIGVASAGIGVGIFALVPFAQLLIDWVGVAPTPSRPSWTLPTVVRTWRFWGTGAVFFAGSAATQMLLVHQAYLVDHGAPALVGATVVGVVGVCSVAGKAGWGALSDRVGRQLAYTLAFLCVAASVGLLALAGAHPRTLVPYGYAILIGVGLRGDRAAHAGDRQRPLRRAPLRPHLRDLALRELAAMALLAPTLLWVVAPRRPNPAPASSP
jgi:hypothetical protein